MRYILLILTLLVGCFTRTAQLGRCLVYRDDYIIQVTDYRGLTMLYVRQWDFLEKKWGGKYPADTWTLLGWDTIECPKQGGY